MSTITPLKKEDDLKSLIQSPGFREQVAKALPKHITADRMMRVMLTAVNKNPKLLSCTRESLLGSLMTCSQFGLEPDGRNAHLIPYGNTCQLIFDFKGKVELLMRTGLVASIHADVICENDEFEYDRGEIKKHKINFKEDRGTVYAVYVICRLKDGTEKSEVMNRQEVEAIRKRSKSGSNGPWVTDWNEMAKKTVFHRMSKWLPISPEIRDIIQKDQDNEFGEFVSAPTTVSPAFELPKIEARQEGSGEIPSSEMSIEQIRSQLEKSGCNEKALINYLLEEGLLPKSKPTLEGLTDDRAFMIVKGFETISQKIKEVK